MVSEIGFGGHSWSFRRVPDGKGGMRQLTIDEAERENVRRIREFILESSELHMFLCSHFCYPPRTRIITFSRKKPLAIMYKEMLPLELIIE